MLGLRGRRVAVAVAAVAASVLLVAPRAVAAPRAPGGLAVVSDDVVGDPRLHELTVQSPALGRSAKVRVLLPAGYDDPAEAARRYPVLFLLHGAGDDQTSWTTHTDVAALSATTPIIIVMPEAGKSGNAGWYSDWQQGPAWESFHIGELVPFVDATYRTTGNRSGRAVAGLSMGGFGAMSYAARHPELFGTAASFSGAVDTTGAGDVESVAFALLHSAGGTPNDQVWGPYSKDEAVWRSHNPTDLATNLRWTALWLACGNGVPAQGDSATDAPFEAGVYTMNLTFDAALAKHGVAHESHFRDHGVHAWSYWQADLHAWWPTLLDSLAHPPAPPAAFDYRSADPTFSAWGWSFGTDRPGPQFVDLSGVSPEGFTVVGSGRLSVTSAPAYAAGAIEVVTGDDGSRVEVTADGAGRIGFTVDLGPGHAAPPSPVVGIAVDGVSTDQRVTRRITIAPETRPAGTEVEARDVEPLGATGPALLPTTLPATGGDRVPAAWGALLLVLAVAGRAARRTGRPVP